jgi:glutamate--cysteine ligase catalytic subunit
MRVLQLCRLKSLWSLDSSQTDADGDVSKSLFIPDICIQPHPRFPTLTANIRKRRGEKVMMPVPIYKDERTHETLAKQKAEIEAGPNAEQVLRDLPPDSIYLDCMAFGMGAGCLQMTFQVRLGTPARKHG